MTPELHRPIPLDRVGPQGLDHAVDAGPEERAAVALRLRVLAVGALRCDFALRRIGGSVIEARGTLRASMTESCVVTLDPFDHVVQEAFTLHFVPAGTEDEEPEPDAIDQIPVDGGTIDLGEAVVEQLALSLDPYPRSPGASLPTEFADVPSGPFAALMALRPRE